MMVFTQMTRRDTDGCPQADGVVGQQLPEMDSNRKKIVHGGHGGTRMMINDY